MEEVGLVDIELAKLNPTWRNNRVGETWVSKRIDRFLLSKLFIEEQVRFK
jgi:hypothetical protein